MPGISAQPWVDPVVGFQLFARAGAGVGQAMVEQIVQYLGIGLMPLALSDQFTLPLEAIAFQGMENRCLGAGLFTGWVEVFHAHQPAAVIGAGIEVGGEGGNQRAEMQMAAGRGGETPDIGRGCHGPDTTGKTVNPRNKNGAFARPIRSARQGYLPTCFSLISAKVLQSTHRSAVGRASRRRIPISTPQDSHQPYSSSLISCSVLSIFLISLRSRSRARSSRANSSSWLARSAGSGKLAASSFIWSTVRSTSCIKSCFHLLRILVKCSRMGSPMYSSPFFST